MMEAPSPNTAEKAIRAKEYIAKLQKTLTPDNYKRFLGIMSRFKKRQLTKRGLISEVDELFSDLNREDLIGGFEVFLPAGVTVDMIREGNSKCSTFSETYSRFGSTLEESVKPASTVLTATAPAAEPHASDWTNHPKRANSYVEEESLQPHKKIHFEESESIQPEIPIKEQQVSPFSSLSDRMESPTALADSNPWFGAPSVAPVPGGALEVPEELGAQSYSEKKVESDDLMVDFTYKVQLRFLEDGFPGKYHQFLNLITESRVSPSSYPAAIYQATQLLKDQPDLLSEFKAVIARVSFAGLLPPSPPAGASILAENAAVSSVKKAHHRKSKSMGSWANNMLAENSASVPCVPGSHSRKSSLTNGDSNNTSTASSPTHGAGRRSSIHHLHHRQQQQQHSAAPLSTLVNVSDRTPLLMTYEDWCREHARRTGTALEAGVPEIRATAGDDADGWPKFWKRVRQWMWKGTVFIGIVGCGALVMVGYIGM
ncbi:hypothetical protein BDR26DRAFT_1004761 [Obelidium mucronatum]|nr:hypothetical protein BDR26DRAFT_1004761 [Obelidium mucronatum]